MVVWTLELCKLYYSNHGKILIHLNTYTIYYMNIYHTQHQKWSEMVQLAVTKERVCSSSAVSGQGACVRAHASDGRDGHDGHDGSV